MGIGNFFDSFICGIAYGMMGFNPYYGGFGGSWNSQRVDFETFANPFPNPFPNVSLSDCTQPPTILTNFVNQTYPTLDYSNVFQSIWDTVTNPDSPINKQTNEYLSRMEKYQSSQNNNFAYTQTYPMFSMPFSPYFFPQYETTYIQDRESNSSLKKTESEIQENKPVKNETEEIKKVKIQSNNNTQVSLSDSNDENFNKMLKFVLQSENEYSNDPDDRGGETYKGITTATYNAYRKSKGLSKQSVKKMTEEEMREIYYENFYKASGADKISDKKLALYVFDTAVNMGVKRAKSFLNASNGDLHKFETMRRQKYKEIATKDRTQKKYLNGWNNRVTNVKNYADEKFSAVA